MGRKRCHTTNKITYNARLQDCIEVDNELRINGFPTDTDPIAIGTENDVECSVEETIHQPTGNDVKNYLRTLNLYFQRNDEQ